MEKRAAVLAILVVAFSMQLYGQIPTNGLVAYYPFNGNANDASGLNYNGTVNGATLSPDRFGGLNSAYHFTGGEEISLPNVFKSASFTFCGWAYSTSDGYDHVIFTEYQDGDNYLKLFQAYKNNQIGAYLKVAGYPTKWGTQTVDGSAPLNTWNFVCLVLNSSTDSASLFVNGVENVAIKMDGFNLENFGSISSTGLGRSHDTPSTDNFEGSIDDVRLYDRALTSDEILTLYHEGGWPVGKHTPVIIIPGIMGSPLYNDKDNNNTLEIGERVWIRLDANIAELWLDDTGNNPSDPFNVIKPAPLRYGSESFDKPLELYSQPLSYYRGLVDELEGSDSGYKLEGFNNNFADGSNLFLFAYDWRLSNSRSADSLSTLIENICAGTGSTSVDIVAHSMGGIIVKEYIHKHTSAKVRKLIFVGTPHEGAPDAINKSVNGLSWLKNIALGGTKKIRTMSRNSSAIYELLPTSRYCSLYDPQDPGFLYAFDPNTNKFRLFSYAGALNSLVQARDQQGAAVFNAGLLDVAISEFQPGIKDVIGTNSNVYNIVGFTDPNKPCTTIGSIYLDHSKSGDIVVNAVGYTDGDGTVPITSAQYVGSSKTTADYYINGVGHVDLPSSSPGRKIIAGLLKDPPTTSFSDPLVSTTLPKRQVGGVKQITVGCPVTLDAYDVLGNHTGPISDSTWDENIPGSAYIPGDLTDPESHKTILLSDGQDYQIKIKSQDTTSWFRMDVVSSDSTGSGIISIFDSVAVKPATIVTCSIGGTIPLKLLRDFNGNGNIDTIASPRSLGIVTFIGGFSSESRIPTGYPVSQNFPNPFNPTTTIRYGLPKRSSVMLTVFNTLGQKITTLVNETQEAGYQEVKFDGTNLASGVYFYRIQAGSFVQTKKFVLLR